MKNDYGFTVEYMRGLVDEFEEFNSKEDWCDCVEFTMNKNGKKIGVQLRLIPEEEE